MDHIYFKKGLDGRFEKLESLGHENRDQAIMQGVNFVGDMIMGLAKEGKRATVRCTNAYVGVIAFSVENSQQIFGTVAVGNLD